MTPILVAVCAMLLVLSGFAGRQWYRYRARYLSAQKTLSQQDTEIGRLSQQAQEQAQRYGVAIAQLNQRLQHLQAQAEDSSSEISIAQHEADTLRSSKTALEQRLTYHTAHMEELNRDYQQTIAQLKLTIADLSQAKKHLSQMLQANQKELTQLYRDIESTIEEETQDYTEQITRLTATVQQLEKDKQNTASAHNREKGNILLIKATEPDLYPEEKKAIVLDVLQNAIEGLPERSRRETVIKNVVDNNCAKFHRDILGEEVRKWFKAYNGMNRKMRHALEHLGFQIETDGGHYKMRFQDDGRYKLTFSKTPSDWRSGRNIIKEIRSRFL